MSDHKPEEDTLTPAPVARQKQEVLPEEAKVHRLPRRGDTMPPPATLPGAPTEHSEPGLSAYERLRRAASIVLAHEQQRHAPTGAAADTPSPVNVSSLAALRQASSKELPARGWLKTSSSAVNNSQLMPLPQTTTAEPANCAAPKPPSLLNRHKGN